MKKILLPMLLGFVVACGSPEKKEGSNEQVTESTPDVNSSETEEDVEPERPVDLPEDINQETLFTYENDTVKQEISITLESADDMYFLYSVQDAELTCALRYEGSASSASARPELLEATGEMESSFPAKAYIFQDELCSLVIFLAEDRSQVEIKPLDCEERYVKCPAWSVNNLTRRENGANSQQ